MDKFEAAKKLMRCFPESFINYHGEFIAHKKSNTFLILDPCKDERMLNCRVLEWFSRAAFKTEPYNSDRANHKFHRFMLDGVNAFLGTAFTFDDMELIYTHLGNAINKDLTIKFVESGYDMEVLLEYEREN